MKVLSFDADAHERKIFFGDVACNFESIADKQNAETIFMSMNCESNNCWNYYVAAKAKKPYPFSILPKFEGFEIFENGQLRISYIGGEGYLHIEKILRDFIDGVKGYAI
ncbi:hypothetical protein [Rugamonas sp. DEMB1]|uniref:hypothetical protein n=1 Tax=Rugamonas sp. DEMB1 TaxID=3039386 RepID=UPI002448AB19|nr:hypothetical protein [Rugamonas sp. DEMB1]WGG48127.1 hypothetical protein QC826_15385 [Rugamonas sp. DEMB1]